MTLYYLLVVVAIAGATLAVEHYVVPKIKQIFADKGWVD